MIIMWEPAWYDLDQSIIIGEESFFYLTKDKTRFAAGLSSEDELEVVAKIISIKHSFLNNVSAIDCNGLDYYIYYDHGKKLTVCSEEDPGSILDGDINSIDDWSFKISIEIIEDTGLKAIDRRTLMKRLSFKEYWRKRRANQEKLIAGLHKQL